MNVTIDGKQVELTEQDINIVELAKRASVKLPAPCYIAKRKKGCCKGCVVEVDGEQKYACVTKPEPDMSIIVDREDLNELRKSRIAAYRDNQNSPDACCDCDCSQTSGCC